MPVLKLFTWHHGLNAGAMRTKLRTILIKKESEKLGAAQQAVRAVFTWGGCFGGYNLPRLLWLLAHCCRSGVAGSSPFLCDLVNAALVLAGHPAETPVRGPERPAEASPPGAHPELHHSAGELSRDVSERHEGEGR